MKKITIKKYMIKIKESDRLLYIINKINKLEDDEIILDIAFGHPILHNKLSLKIIKSKSKNKKITILTSDISSKKIGEAIGINYSLIKDKDLFQNPETKKNILKHNFTFKEYLFFELRKYLKLFLKLFKKKKTLDNYIYSGNNSKQGINGVSLIILGLFMSIGMFIFIFYFAVNKSYIIINPEINIKYKSKNIVYKESSGVENSIFSNETIIPLRKITAKASLEEVFQTSQIDYTSTKRAKGKVILINELFESQSFRPNTRLETKSGIIYEIKDWSKIEKATKNGSGKIIPGKTEIMVEAKLYDNSGEFIGKRGNTENQIFTIPGLKFNKDKIYAISKGKIEGGTDDYDKIISKSDLKNSKKIMEEKLKNQALKNIEEKIKKENNMNNAKYEILNTKDIIKYKNIKIESIGNLKEGDKSDNFKLKGEIEIETYIYNKSLVINSLKEVINDSLLKGSEKLVFINDKSLRISNVLSRNEKPIQIKATTQIEIGVVFNFDNNGNYYVRKIKNDIAGINKKDAQNILINDTKISNVKIKTTPFFLKNISNIPENIILKISDE